MSSHYDAPPHVALAAIRDHGGQVLVDFDETLYLRISTEDFIDSVWPGLLGVDVPTHSRRGEPWRLTGGTGT
jgi:hypothetical protein